MLVPPVLMGCSTPARWPPFRDAGPRPGRLSASPLRPEPRCATLVRMFPTLGDILGADLPVPTHEVFVGLGVLVAALVFVVEARRRGQTDERLLHVVAGALVGGALFMRLGTWLQHLDLRANASLGEQWLYGNRSVLGGLVGAW